MRDQNIVTRIPYGFPYKPVTDAPFYTTEAPLHWLTIKAINTTDLSRVISSFARATEGERVLRTTFVLKEQPSRHNV